MSCKREGLRLALEHSPQNAPLLALYGQACLDDFQLADARAAFERLVQLEPGGVEGRLGLARVNLIEGKSSEAAVRVEQLLQQHPRCAPALVLLSRIHAAEGDLAKASELYALALQIDPSHTDPGMEKALREFRSKSKAEPPRQRAGLAQGGESVEASEDDPLEEDHAPLGGDAFDLGLDGMERPKLSFSEVGGMDALKEEIRMKIIYPLQHAGLFKAYDKKIGGGVLLYGPPGCGKTLISRATAGEVQARFLALGLHQILDMWIGNSEKHMHAVFELARKNAPCVLFFDEVDALAADRKDLRQSAGRTLINQFLAELDGAEGNNDGVLILGATNAPWHIDPAFRRPGRFDRTVFVPPPDEAARASIIQVLARGKPVGELDPRIIAKKCPEYSGADLKALFDLATEEALASAMKSGNIVPLVTKDLLKAAGRHKPTTRAWFESAKNYALFANQGGYYDEVLKYLGLAP